MNYIYRNRCLITGKDDLEHLYTLKNLPIFIGCTDQPQTEDIKEDLEIYISKSSGIIQLKKLIACLYLFEITFFLFQISTL